MRSCLPLSFRVVSASFLLLLSAAVAKGQCGVNTRGFDELGIVPGNPFHAEIVTTRSGSPAIEEIVPTPHPQMVARDSQGRVRVDRVAGKFKHDTGPEAGSEAEDHIIDICDTGVQTLTQIDTLNATAKIVHSRPSAVSHPAPNHPRTFCSTRVPSHLPPNMSVEDLGTLIIEGVETHGERLTIKPLLGASATGDSLGGESVSEIWCSEELSAEILRVSWNTRGGLKTTIAMRNIERTEPDPALFEIPPDYSVTESVTPPHRIQRPNVQSNDPR